MMLVHALAQTQLLIVYNAVWKQKWLCRTLIEECADVDPSKMQAKLCFVRFDALAQHIGQKVLSCM